MRGFFLVSLLSFVALINGIAVDSADSLAERAASIALTRNGRRAQAPNNTVYTCVGSGVYKAVANCCTPISGCVPAPTPFVCPDFQNTVCFSSWGSQFALTASAYSCPVAGYSTPACCEATDTNSCVSPAEPTFKCGNIASGHTQYRYPNCCSDKTFKTCYPRGAMIAPVHE
ncbi:hypothetical protein DACRYDRAFT_110709 [Dacryopinax primogenitus]|uniref:Uncharacterized protein n=1 Tax=Dacryopinax primogenitus (strain DJM 731) TaxID=1858805 RepID=M5FPW2_DACPD|nr:uncharacterized protein DACRYDRAFT_110709 [Dacryopinax primogenitus]EJT98820.1 hypothetical protein DACRYDRAFT_110709 [Dacryopinax primogenitus]